MLFPQTARQVEQAQARMSGLSSAIPIVPNAPLHAAALHHQNYKLRRHDDLLAAFRARLPSEEAFARSAAATRANAYVAGHRAPARLDEDRERLGVPSDCLQTLRQLAQSYQGWQAFVGAE